jgi:gas vesicle protein
MEEFVMNEYPYGNDVGQGSSNNMMGFFVGALVGAGVALLLAPAPGGDTRRRVADTAKRIGSAAKDKVSELRGQADQMAGDMGRESYMQGRQGAGQKPGQTV